MPTLTADKTTPPEPGSWQQLLSEQTCLQDAVHQPHQRQRDRIMETLAESGDKNLQRQASSMSQCAASLHLFFNQAEGTVREYLHTCKARLCPLCGRRRSAHVAAQITPLVDAMKRPRHLVLTVKSRPDPLRQQITDLVTWFGKFRRTAWWRQNVTQGVYTIEATINERTGLWHPHLHIIFDGNYLPVKRIQYLWHIITGGSEIVWIEEAYSNPGLIAELCKYIGKPQKSEHWTDDQLREYALAIRGTRMVQTFGKKLLSAIRDENPPDEPKRDDDSISLSRIVWLATHGNEPAMQALPLLAMLSKHMARFIYAMMPQLEPDLTPAQRLLKAYAIIDAGRAPPATTNKPPPIDKPDLERQLAPLLSRAACAQDSWYTHQPQAPVQQWSF